MKLIAQFFLFLALTILAFEGQGASVDGQQIKSAYIYQFAKFIEWPSRVNEPVFTICAHTSMSFRNTLASIERQQIRGKPVEFKRVNLDDKNVIDILQNCHVLYRSIPIKDLDDSTAQFLNSSAIVVIGEARKDGIDNDITFSSMAGKLRFSIRLSDEKNEQLEFGSDLLKLAVNVSH